MTPEEQIKQACAERDAAMKIAMNAVNGLKISFEQGMESLKRAWAAEHRVRELEAELAAAEARIERLLSGDADE